ncbi:hypothetical protein F4824DRAFT_497961 [Ustulina deusta]|nr:hypothetical protein F4823DRAFT_561714 [Ustulina deusta]KAI3339838.1 hypothetical protein F4824DRAFT_497961 [Ustulina deusta]
MPLPPHFIKGEHGLYFDPHRKPTTPCRPPIYRRDDGDDNEGEESSTLPAIKPNTPAAEAQPNEPRPCYQIRFRHVNCWKKFRSENSTNCEPIMEWYPAFSDDIPAEIDIATSLDGMVQGICLEKCQPHASASAMEAYIVWNNSPPATLGGGARQPGPGLVQWRKRNSGDSIQVGLTPNRPHQPRLELADLELMRQRNCGDYIQVNFITKNVNEHARPRGMSQSLTKLWRKLVGIVTSNHVSIASPE